jgi:dTDP-4-dehydrorhamnose reductase
MTDPIKKVAVIGGSGMVASRFIDLAKEKFDITSLDEKTVDITYKESVDGYFSQNHYDVIVNFAAYTNVDGAEAQKGDKKGLVWRLNVEGPENLADYASTNNVFLIQISTDFVFPGNEVYPGPYTEESKLPDTPDGIGWYGWTKNRAEHMLKGANCRNAIVRYGYPFRADPFDLKLDWARNLIKAYSENKLYPLFADQTQSVIFVDDMVAPLSKIIESEKTGIFHIVASDTGTPYELGKYLLEKYTGTKVKIEKGHRPSVEVPGKAPRPKLGGLRADDTERILGMKFRSWREMVDEFITQLKNK